MRRLLLVLGLLLLASVPTAGAVLAAPSEIQGWTPVSCSCDRALTLDAVDAGRVYLGTSTGVSRSDDGGWTWKPQTLPVSGEVRHLSFADRNVGAAVGDFEGVAVTSDGGTTWRQYRPWPGRSLDVAVLPGRMLGLATTGLYTSTDRGVVWKKTATLEPLDTFANMDWSSARTGVVASGAFAWTTTDGGASFTRARVSATFDFVSLSLGPHEALTAGMRGIHDGSVFIGRVDGDDLTPLTLERRGVADEQVRGLSRSGSVVYAVGVEGLIARSTDLGVTWTYERPPPSFERSSLYDVEALDADHAWAAVFSGRVLIRNASTEHDVTIAPNKSLGIGLLGLAGLAAAGAVGVVATKRPKPLAGALAGVTLASGVPGVMAALDRDTCHPNGCRPVVSRTEDGAAFVPLPSETPSPSPTPSATPSPVTSATPSPTASPTPSPTPSPVTSRSPRPTVVPTVGSFTLSPATQTSTCGVNPNQQGVPQTVQVTLRNSTTLPVQWSAAARETDAQQQPWATISPSSGQVLPGRTRVVRITPTVVECQPGAARRERHVDVTYGPDQRVLVATVHVQPQN